MKSFNIAYYITFICLTLSNQSIIGQCYKPFVDLDCHGGLYLNLEEAYRLAVDRHIIQYDGRNLAEKNNNERLLVIQKHKTVLDSIFQITKKYIVGEIGEDNYCKRIEFHNESFRYFYPYRDTVRGINSLQGSFDYKFHYEPISCWNSKGTKLTFKFEIDGRTGKFDITYPDVFPDCTENDCNFVLPNIPQKAMDLDLIDGTVDYSVRVSDANHSYLTIKKLPFEEHQYIFNLKTGDYVGDTLIFHSPYWGKITNLDELIDYSTAIVDATCDSTSECQINNYAYTNYFYTVHHVLKGEHVQSNIVLTGLGGKNQSWSHSIGLPSPKTRAIFFLIPYTEEQKSRFHCPDLDTLRHQWWVSIGTPYSYPFRAKNKIYTELFPTILERTNTKLQVFHPPNLTSEDTKKWLDSLGKNEWIEEEGNILWSFPPVWNQDSTEVGVNIFMTCTKDYNYLINKNLVIEYDTSFVMSYAVRSKIVRSGRFYLLEKSLRMKSNLSSDYEITLKDISANQIGINIALREGGSISQINPKNRFYNDMFYPIVTLTFDVKKTLPEGKFRIELKPVSNRKIGTYYNPISRKKKKYKYQKILNLSF